MGSAFTDIFSFRQTDIHIDRRTERQTDEQKDNLSFYPIIHPSGVKVLELEKHENDFLLF